MKKKECVAHGDGVCAVQGMHAKSQSFQAKKSARQRKMEFGSERKSKHGSRKISSDIFS